MNPRTGLARLARWIGVLSIVLVAPAAKAEETEGYAFAKNSLSYSGWQKQQTHVAGPVEKKC